MEEPIAGKSFDVSKISPKADVKALSFEELRQELEALGLPKFRAGQVFDWLHQKTALRFDEMTNLSKDLQKKLSDRFFITSLTLQKKQVSEIDGTIKYLLRLEDGNLLETVLMKYKHGNSLCISTQVGCKMGCSFCASTKAGFVRNLTPSEMLEEIYYAERESGEKVSNVVLMGIGEPLDNYDNVLRFFELISDEKGKQLSLRHISLSTCGLVNRINDLAEKRLGVTLSVSLHAPNDLIRNQTMPINRQYNISTLLAACDKYARHTGRRVSFEYALIRGINDSDACADELCARLRGMLCHVNLIPVNEIKETDFVKSERGRVQAFCDRLNKRGITATVRRTLGSDISAACGQLRNNMIEASD